LSPFGTNTIGSETKKEPVFKKGDYLFVGAIIALALVLRILYLIDIKDNPFFNVLLVDADYHDIWAMEILNGDWFSLKKGVLYKAPLYPYFLALVYGIFGHDLLISRVVQIVFALAGYTLLYWLAIFYFDRTVARITLLGTIFYGTLIYFEGELEIVVLVITLNLFLLFLLSRNLFHPSRTRWFFAGLILGLSALARPTILLFIPLVLVWLFFVLWEQGGLRKVADSTVFFLMGIVLIISPVTVRNSMLGEKFVLISSNGGINFYLGNNPDHDETTSIQPGVIWDRLTKEPSMAAGRDLTIEDAASYWYSRSGEFIFSEPISYMALVLKKATLFWHSYEIKRNKDIYFFKRYSTMLQLPLLTFGIVAPLALMGIVISLSRWRNYLLLYFYILYVMMSSVVFFVTARYRLPVVPVLMIFAGYSLHWFYQQVREKERKRVVTFLLLFLIPVFLINYDFFDVKEKTFARPHFNLGLVYSTTKQYDRAIEEFKKSLELNPPGKLENAETHLNLSILYKQKGEYDRAIEQGQKALSILPDYARAYRIMAEIHLKTERYAQAIEELNQSLGYEPNNAESYFLIGEVYYQQERYAEAGANYKNAISLKPDYPEPHYGLGMIFYQNGRLQEAKNRLQRAIEEKPDFTQAHYNLAVIYDEMGLLDEAIKSYAKTIELDNGHFMAYNNLGIIYGRKNQYDKAVVQFQKALEIKPGDEEAMYNLETARKKIQGR
jgi:tetratricopeptide (TPR) repeat protein